MPESEPRPVDPAQDQGQDGRLKSLQVRIAIVVSLIGAFWLFVNYLYDRTVGCGVDYATCSTEVAALELTVEAQASSEQKEIIRTVEVTVVHTVILTTTPDPHLPVPTSTPTQLPYQSQGNCNEAFTNAPCTLVLSEGDRWEQIAQDSPYGDSCRYPEIMNVNRRSDGSYPRLSGYDNDIGRPITILPAAPPGVYTARMRNALGEFSLIPDCDQDAFPCVFTVTEQLPIFSYAQVSQSVYKNNVYGDVISQMNLASDCTRHGVKLLLGTQLVIPKRPVLAETPSN